MLRKPGGKLRIKGRKYNYCNLWDFWPITSPFMEDLRVKKNNLGSKWPVLKLSKLWPELVQCGQNWKVGPTFEFNRIPSSWREGHQYENVCKIYFETEDNCGKRQKTIFGQNYFSTHSFYQWAISEFVIDELLLSMVIKIDFIQKPKDLENCIQTTMIVS